MNRENFIISIGLLICGLLLNLAFAPFNYYLLAIVMPSLLLMAWRRASPKQAFWQGLWYGAGFFAGGVYWVFISIHTYGNADVWLAGLLTACLIFFLALFVGIQGLILNYSLPKASIYKYLIFFPCLATLSEWLRSWVLTGFPWLLLGYSQINSPLKAIAPILGVYGVSLAVYLNAGACSVIYLGRKNLRWLFVGFFTLLILWIGGYALQHKTWTKTLGRPVTVSLIQGNISQALKWHKSSEVFILNYYQQLIVQALEHSQLVILPEAAIPNFSWAVQDYLDKLTNLAKQRHATIILGIPIERRLTGEYYNGMIALGSNSSTYLKRHLVPFGEYPFLGGAAKLIMALFNVPMSDFTKGPFSQADFRAANLIVAPSICYEIAFPYETLDFLPKANILINVTDDSWFGKSTAAVQQLTMAQMRALETGRYQLTSTNTGITAIIDQNGNVQHVALPFISAVISGSVYAMIGNTPWVAYGRYVWLFLVICGILPIFSYKVIKKRN